MVLVEPNSVMVLTTGITTTAGVLAMLANAPVTTANVTTQFAVSLMLILVGSFPVSHRIMNARAACFAGVR